MFCLIRIILLSTVTQTFDLITIIFESTVIQTGVGLIMMTASATVK